MRGDENAISYMEKIDREGRMSTTSINAYEILFGAGLSKIPENSEETVKLLGKLDILPFDTNAAERASEIHSTLSSNGQQINIKDILIASIAIVNEMILVTRNIKDFSRIKDLKIEKWQH